jgi:predicted Fe-Mo cluster-binding NifX family protein
MNQFSERTTEEIADGNMKQRWIIAVATSNGVDIAAQLGNARSFAIYEVSPRGELRLVEYRSLREKTHLPFYSSTGLSPFLDGIDLLIVAELGEGAFQTLAKRGTRVLRLQGRVEYALECMTRSRTTIFGIREQASTRASGEQGQVVPDRVNPCELDWTQRGIFGHVTRGLA